MSSKKGSTKKTLKDLRKRPAVGEMVVYLHEDRQKPTLLIPLNDELFLAWVKRDEISKPEWTLKSIKYIYSMHQAIGDECTPFDVCSRSEKLTEATPLEVLVITAMSIEQVHDVYDKHMNKIGGLDTKKKKS